MGGARRHARVFGPYDLIFRLKVRHTSSAKALRLVTRRPCNTAGRGLRFLEFRTRQTSPHGCPTISSLCNVLSVPQ